MSAFSEFTTILSEIHSPADVKQLDKKQLPVLAQEIRKKIIEVVGKNGGHLASNLGVVELTIALHRVFDSPEDAFVWDVSHQCYTHKLLTGRYDSFDTLRKKNGLSGFTKRQESPHDFFDAGHSSTSVSSALGLLTGRMLRHQKGKVIAVIGDGALTGGMAMEALSHAGQISKDLIVVLNDNQMSISKNTGSLSRYLSRMTMTSSYQTFRFNIDRFVDRLPLINKFFTKFIFRFKRAIKALLYSNNFFVDLGFEYVGPLNGHNFDELEQVFTRVKKLNRPVVVHVVTRKGRGYSPAENDPARFHGIGPFCISDGTVEKFDTLSFTEAFSNALLDAAERDSHESDGVRRVLEGLEDQLRVRRHAAEPVAVSERDGEDASPGGVQCADEVDEHVQQQHGAREGDSERADRDAERPLDSEQVRVDVQREDSVSRVGRLPREASGSDSGGARGGGRCSAERFGVGGHWLCGHPAPWSEALGGQ